MKIKSLTSYTRKHYLHKAYLDGFDANMRGEDWCPYVGNMADWWWAGWTEGVGQKNDS